MNPKRLAAIIAVLVTAWSWPASGEACSCLGTVGPCQAVSEAAAVFVGHVVSISSTGERTVEFAVDETFRGRQASQLALSLGGGCDFPFEIGGSYLVYAYHGNGKLSTSICSRTRRLQDAEEDLAYMRLLAGLNPDTAGRLAGRVVLQEHRSRSGWKVRAFPSLVTATGGGRVFSVVANGFGEFEFTGLPLGRYDIVAVVSDGYATTKGTVDVHEPVACETTQLVVQYDGRVTGHVVDFKGESVAGLAIELVSVADVAPAAEEPGFASEIVVGGGESVRLDDFVLPESLTLTTVTGIVIDEAGRAVRNARVMLRDDNERPRAFIPGLEVVTGSDGRFVISMVANRNYFVHVIHDVGAGLARGSRFASVRFRATAGSPELIVVMSPDPDR